MRARLRVYIYYPWALHALRVHGRTRPLLREREPLPQTGRAVVGYVVGRIVGIGPVDQPMRGLDAGDACAKAQRLSLALRRSHPRNPAWSATVGWVRRQGSRDGYERLARG